jgi:hypothetical protein
MASTDKIFIGIDDQVIELTGDAKKEYLANKKIEQEAYQLLEAEYKAKQDSRESAIKKLAEIAGLTQEELASIL